MNKQDGNSEVVNRFALVAERFCSLVDTAATVEKTEFLVQVYRLLPELIGEAIRLPEIQSDDGEDDDADEVPDDFVETTMKQVWAQAQLHHQEWEPLYRALTEKLGDWNLYWQVFDPTKDKEAIHGTLADDISGIYCDLKKGIRLMENRKAPAEDVIFEWRNGFYIHWGRHAIDSLKTIHALLEDTFTGLNRSD